MVLILFISSAVTKVGRLFVNTQTIAVALIQEWRLLIKFFSVKVRHLFESRLYSSSGAKNQSFMVCKILGGK